MTKHQTAIKASREDTAETAAAFGAEGVERGDLFIAWAFRCWCGEGMHMAKGVNVNDADRLARQMGWRFTSKRGWQCPAHRRPK